MAKPVILTGIRSNGELTLGNYLGAILPLVNLQKQRAGDYQVNMFVPDLHSFTTPIDHGLLYQNTLDNLRLFAAAGLNLDQPDTYVYRQSYISAHSELTWVLDCFAYYGELSRMTQFKDKSEGQDSVSVGLFNYPVLMAADILLYGAQYVPVGEDQRQHLELARDLAIRLNNKFGEGLLVEPKDWDAQMEFSGLSNGVRIRSLRNPEKKMSKSIEDPAGTILLSDNPSEAAKKIMNATTDNEGVVRLDYSKQPGISNLLQIHALLSNESLQKVAEHYDGQTNYGDLKKEVADQVAEFLEKLQADYQQVSEQTVIDALERDEAAMRASAKQTLLRVQQAVGLRPA